MSNQKATTTFSQSAAVTRCRNIKETKLKAQNALAKLADEEVTVYSANLDDWRHQLRTQLAEQSSVTTRQLSEAKDTEISWERKDQLTKLIDKLTSIKSLLRFQEEARERELAFKSSIRQKRAAFSVRLARLEQRHSAERLAETIRQIRAIEIKSIKDKNKQRRFRRENEIQSQQSNMRQQKARHMAEINDLEINNMEEIEDMQTVHRREEYELAAKHSLTEAELSTELERQKYKLEANQLLDRQATAKVSLQRAQRKQAQALAKMLIAENPIIRSDTSSDNFVAEDDASQSEGQSEGTSRSGGSMASLHNEKEQIAADETGSDTNFEKSEAEKNSALNRNTQVLSEAEKELQSLIEAGNERNRNVAMHHKKIAAELKQQHRTTLSQKTKEQRRKIADLLKDQEEEIEQLKMEQAATMKELLETHLHSEEMRADTGVAQNLLGMMLPSHIMEKIEQGQNPEPEQFSFVSLFFTDIFEFKKLVGAVPPEKILQLLNILYAQFDSVIAKYNLLYKGLIGTKMSRYCLFGDTVNTASRMCTTGEPDRIQVSSQTISGLGEDDSMEFEVRGEIDVKVRRKRPNENILASVLMATAILKGCISLQLSLLVLI
ncbi:Retinal guanylyl cyclase 2 [Entophlyctis luteolus]|nr:Retinal guanylyl cyclase 2 [Entophlyctis luteolus]